MGKPEKRSELSKREERTAYKLLLPALIILLVIAIYPLGQVFYTSFTDRQFASGQETEFIGFKNYQRLLSVTVQQLPQQIDPDTNEPVFDEEGKPVYERAINVLPREPYRYRDYKQFSLFGNRYVLGATDVDFIDAVANTLGFTIASVFLELTLGLGIALVVNSSFKGRGVTRTAMLIPWAVITVVSARMWEWMLAPNRTGFFNTFLAAIGAGDGRIAFLASSQLQLWAMIAVDVWKTTPFMALLLLAGMQTIPDELYEAAAIDGASPIKQFFSITFPLLKPAMAVALIFRTLDALRVFDVFQVLLGQSQYSMATYNYFQLIGNRNMGLASAIGVVIFIIIFGFAVAYIKMLGVDMDETA